MLLAYACCVWLMHTLEVHHPSFICRDDTLTESNLREKEFTVARKFQATVHCCEEVKAETSNSHITHAHTKAERDKCTHAHLLGSPSSSSSPPPSSSSSLSPFFFRFLFPLPLPLLSPPSSAQLSFTTLTQFRTLPGEYGHPE